MDTPQPQPAPAPKPSFPAKHSHIAFWVFLILSLILIVVIAVFALQTLQGKNEAEGKVTQASAQLDVVQGQLDEAQGQLAIEMQNLEVAKEKVQEVQDAIPPFFYNVSSLNSEGLFLFEIHMIDRLTGTDSIVDISAAGNWSLLAAPEVNYDGRIFVRSVPTGGTDAPGSLPYVHNVNEEGDPQPLSFESELPASDATLISPNGEHLVAAYDNSEFGVTGKNLVIWNLLTGESEDIGKVAEDEYLAEYSGPNAFGGANGYNLFWTSGECVNVTVYEDAEIAEGEEVPVKKVYKESRTFCRS